MINGEHTKAQKERPEVFCRVEDSVLIIKTEEDKGKQHQEYRMSSTKLPRRFFMAHFGLPQVNRSEYEMKKPEDDKVICRWIAAMPKYKFCELVCDYYLAGKLSLPAITLLRQADLFELIENWINFDAEGGSMIVTPEWDDIAVHCCVDARLCTINNDSALYCHQEGRNNYLYTCDNKRGYLYIGKDEALQIFKDVVDESSKRYKEFLAMFK